MLPARHLQDFLLHWHRWALGFFLLASVFGLSMRAFHVVEIPLVEYRNLLHAHSHLALLGWGFMMLLGAMIWTVEARDEVLAKYRALSILLVISILGMGLTFPVQGYGLFSISFSTAFVIISYGLVFKLWKTLRTKDQSLGKQLLSWALIGYLISTLGLWVLAPVSATLGRMHELYFMSIQWFLHFQLNGWFVLGVLGLLAFQLEKGGVSLNLTAGLLVMLLSSVLLTYALVITWADPSPLFFWINSLAVLLQAGSYSLILWKAFRALPQVQMPPIARKFIQLALISLAAKALLQGLLVVPEVAVMSYTIRLFVIGFLHLVLLGAMTMMLVGIAFQRGWLLFAGVAGLGWILVAVAFVATELLLFAQGVLIWLQLGYVDSYYSWLFWISTLFPIGLSLAMGTLFGRKINIKNNIYKEVQTQSKSQTMKMITLWSISILAILMTACGGGETQSTGSTVKSEAPAPVADPKGIGEIKQVDIAPDVDAALASQGKAIVDMKCTACHQLNDKRLVGPGFQGVTNRRRPEWIMNMITNVDVMLDQDPEARKLLEECLTRMPNQNISLDDARGILEFMRQNDEEKAGQRDAAVN
ncbi:c-type cytochrome [Algoriphagus namhaensis]